MHTTLRQAPLKGLAVGASAAAAGSVFPASTQGCTWRTARIGAGDAYPFNASSDIRIPRLDGLTLSRPPYRFVAAIAVAAKTFRTISAATNLARGIVMGTSPN